MNEAFFKSPKWMTDRKEKKAEEKRQKQAEEEREYNRLKEDERKEKEEKDRKEKDDEDKSEFHFFFNSVINNIFNDYKKSQITIPHANFLTVERDDLLYQNTNFKYKVTLNNTINNPTFNVEITYIKEYKYTVSGLIYIQLKNFFLDTIYEWYKIELLYNKGKQQKQQTYNKQSNDYGGYDYDYVGTKTKPKQPEESEEIKNKIRRYKLLKDTLDGYNRQLTKIKDWERSNPGKTNDEKQIVINQIDNVKDKINNMNKKFKFESIYYLKHLKPILS